MTDGRTTLSPPPKRDSNTTENQRDKINGTQAHYRAAPVMTRVGAPRRLTSMITARESR
jgi:hypothetical protein